MHKIKSLPNSGVKKAPFAPGEVIANDNGYKTNSATYVLIEKDASLESDYIHLLSEISRRKQRINEIKRDLFNLSDVPEGIKLQEEIDSLMPKWKNCLKQFRRIVIKVVKNA